MRAPGARHPLAAVMTFLFASAIDSDCALLADGSRADAMDRGGHYARWEEDVALAGALGLGALRYGPAYYRTHLGPDRFDWEVCDAPLARARANGLTVVACLCDGGVPDWIGGVADIAFPVLFGAYAAAFARRYPWVRHYTPVRDLAGFACRAATDASGALDEVLFARVLRNLCMAHELAVEAILTERPDAIIVHDEEARHVHAAGAASAAAAERTNAFRRAALDLVTAHELAPGMAGWLTARGLTAHDLAFLREPRAAGQRWLGLAYLPTSERRLSTTGRATTARRGLGFRAIATAAWQRYRLPLFHAGTHAPARVAIPWLHAQWADVVALRAAGVPVLGFTWSPLTDRPAARRGAPEALGLADPGRERREIGDAYAALIALWTPVLRERPANDVAQSA